MSEKIGKKIKEKRESKGMTQDQLSEKTGLSIQTISLIENDHRKPSHDTRGKLIDALEIDTKEWF